jgi:hypothetical protein
MLMVALLVHVSAQDVPQDTLRTFGPRIGIDVARFVYYFSDPSQISAEASLDFEVYRNIYPVFELGFSTTSESEETFDYQSGGVYARAGIDYNVLSIKDPSVHHAITAGFRYGMSVFSHSAENIMIGEGYWGDYTAESMENNMTGHWIELVGSMKAEVLPNFFLGWSLRYKILLNPEMDPLLNPELVPGYGAGGDSRTFGVSYSLFYKIPLYKR